MAVGSLHGVLHVDQVHLGQSELDESIEHWLHEVDCVVYNTV